MRLRDDSSDLSAVFSFLRKAVWWRSQCFSEQAFSELVCGGSEGSHGPAAEPCNHFANKRWAACTHIRLSKVQEAKAVESCRRAQYASPETLVCEAQTPQPMSRTIQGCDVYSASTCQQVCETAPVAALHGRLRPAQAQLPCDHGWGAVQGQPVRACGEHARRQLCRPSRHVLQTSQCSPLFAGSAQLEHSR